MADYNGTDEDDIIDVSELDSDIGNIYPGKGNDTVTNATIKHTIVSSPGEDNICLLYTSPSPRDRQKSRMPSSA